MTRVRVILFERGGLISIVALALYIWVAPAHIGGGDNAEFATLGTLGGVAHPSGYPLYLLWLRAMTWLPAENPAHATAIATAILGAAQLVVLHAACRAWGAHALAATVAVAIFAASPLVLQFYTEAEVFALNGLVAATVLWLAADNGPLRGTWKAVALGLIAGLGLANHSTCVLLAPIGLFGAVRAIREATLPRPAVVILAILALAAGFVPYVYLLVTSEPQLAWTHIDDLGGLVHHFLRLDYGSGRLTSQDIPVPYGKQLLALLGSLTTGWLWLPLAVGLTSLVGFCARATAGARLQWCALTASLLLAGPLLLTRFNLEPEGTGLFICQRFHILPTLLLVIPVAVGLDRLAARFARGRAIRLGVGTIIAIFGFAAIAGRSLPHLMRAQSPAIENALRGTLRSLPRDAVMIVSPDSLYFGTGYLQDVLGERRDVVLIGWPMMKSPEYRERLKRRLGFSLPDGDGALTSVEVAEEVFAHGRALVIDAFGGNIARAFPTYPYGLVFRVLSRDTPPPPLREQYEQNKALFDTFDLEYPWPGDDDEPAAMIHVQYARTWMLLAQGLLAAGDRERAELAQQRAIQLAP